ncbi:ABC-F family ATP-binding cassette domain-containing protein [Aciduricibacillus chroicocephali]|uniref:ABC-F family ATP-binding cassette domain-containing protein n=1 Tax=Aciduricibacillus chroicocephali TaxID=3054939 RepID=A0ABY9KWD3_9BACI|nr:ABC-F family ATP-binding cassette domain-containing protein [Bacillaceae bacterium 44XB]
MIVMQINQLSKSFGAEEILSNIKLEIKDRDRVAIVGRNGAGKSTLLKIMAGEMSYDSGDLIKPKEVEIGYLAQHTALDTTNSIWDEMREVFSDLIAREKELRSLEQKMADSGDYTEDEYARLLAEYDRKQHAFDQDGGYSFESEIRAVLTGLDFSEYDYSTPITELSGGQKTRLALGRLLLKKPELLILDEPTNHLDIETLNWLEGYLGGYPGAVAIVSHDRYFLDKTVSIVYEISRHRSRRFVGSYSKYLEQKAADYESELKAYENQQAEIKRTEEFIQRNIVRASTTKRAQSRRKQLEKMEMMDRPLGDESSASFSFQIDKKTGNDVLKIEDVAFRYEGESTNLFEHANFHVNRGERIALVGPNGAGKTTLLKAILGRYTPASGEIRIGSNVEIGYYDQEQTELSSTKTVLKELWDDYPTMMERDVRTVLGNFLFSGDDVLKPVSSLSGGEKARLALAKLMLQRANLLILDEPTNHLDIDSKEVLEAALIDYPGTIVFVSHDRYFINRIADQVVELTKEGTTVYLGDYDYYVEKKEETAEIQRLDELEKAAPKKEEKKNEQALSYKEQKQLQSEKRKIARRIAELEEKIEMLESEHAELEEQMTLPEVFEDHEAVMKLTERTAAIRAQIDEYMEEWTILSEEE